MIVAKFRLIFSSGPGGALELEEMSLAELLYQALVTE